jgi:methyl-accepting chemotaxis protein
MTPEQRLDRVERILGYFVREGRRWRVRKREQDEKINILIQFQMETTDQINKTSELINKTAERVDKVTEQVNKTAEHVDKVTEQVNKTAEHVDKVTEQVNKLAAGHAIHEKEMADLRRSQKLTDKALRSFIDSLRKGRNGSSSD